MQGPRDAITHLQRKRGPCVNTWGDAAVFSKHVFCYAQRSRVSPHPEGRCSCRFWANCPSPGPHTLYIANLLHKRAMHLPFCKQARSFKLRRGMCTRKQLGSRPSHCADSRARGHQNFRAASVEGPIPSFPISFESFPPPHSLPAAESRKRVFVFVRSQG